MSDTTPEPRETRLKRLRIRCWRRGTKEMDLLLGGFADAEDGMATLAPTELDALERFMSENDQDLYAWLSGQGAVPEAHSGMVARLRAFHQIP